MINSWRRWSSDSARWTVEARRAGGERVVFTCRFLFMCTGYYDYAGGYTPDFPDVERYRGRVVHPQSWTEDIAYAERRVVVIGSGATAVGLMDLLDATAPMRYTGSRSWVATNALSAFRPRSRGLHHARRRPVAPQCL